MKNLDFSLQNHNFQVMESSSYWTNRLISSGRYTVDCSNPFVTLDVYRATANSRIPWRSSSSERRTSPSSCSTWITSAMRAIRLISSFLFFFFKLFYCSVSFSFLKNPKLAFFDFFIWIRQFFCIKIASFITIISWKYSKWLHF